MSLIVKISEFGSAEYEAGVELRREVLQRPFGITPTQEFWDSEPDRIHVNAIDDEVVVGALMLVPLVDQQIQMRQVAVAPDRQGSGIGRSMVEFCEHWAVANGYSKMVLSARHTAIEFYERLNYVSEGEMYLEVGILHKWMEKDLDK